MKKVKILDCTLRDGGFVNDWGFGLGSIKSIISRLAYAGIDIIEIGFIDERRKYDENRSIFPDIQSIEPIFANMRPKDSILVAMIDFGTLSLEKIPEKAQSSLDGIRVIFKKKDQNAALEYISKIGKKGYKICVNPVSVTEYCEVELITLIEKINLLNPYAVSIVDTYGLMHNYELKQYFNIFDKYLKENIILGYHAHNNFQMAYANSIQLVNNESNREIVIDCSLFGMGKSAGNTCTELIAMYLNNYYGRSFNINQIQEAIDVDISKEFQKHAWGYNFHYYIAALNDCHPNYVQFFINKKTLSICSINEIIQKIPVEQKLSYDEILANSLYENYLNKECDDSETISILKKLFHERQVLLLGPGKTITEYTKEINNYIKKNRPIVVSINFLSENLPIDYVFISNAKRYSQFFCKLYGDKIQNIKKIYTSNITEVGEKLDYVVNYSALVTDSDVIRDNPLSMFLKLLTKLSISEVRLAGFDGYTTDNSKNYYGEYIPFLYCQDNVLLRNDALKVELQKYKSSMSIKTLTPSLYFEEENV